MNLWLTINYERSRYLVNLERISVFCQKNNGKITFWLPESGIAINLNRYIDFGAHHKIVNYIKNLPMDSDSSSWVKLTYERDQYVINLESISSFCFSDNDRLTFWLPDSSIPIIISRRGDPEGYQKVINFLKQKTDQLPS